MNDYIGENIMQFFSHYWQYYDVPANTPNTSFSYFLNLLFWLNTSVQLIKD